MCDRLAVATSPPCPQVPTHPRDYQLLQPLRPPWVLGVGQPRSCSSHCSSCPPSCCFRCELSDYQHTCGETAGHHTAEKSTAQRSCGTCVGQVAAFRGVVIESIMRAAACWPERLQKQKTTEDSEAHKSTHEGTHGCN